MIVRIKLGRGQPLKAVRRTNRGLARGAAALGVPTALMAVTLAIWRLATDLQWTKSFAIESGLLSHWQVWMGVAAALVVVSWRLERYGQADS